MLFPFGDEMFEFWRPTWVDSLVLVIWPLQLMVLWLDAGHRFE